MEFVVFKVSLMYSIRSIKLSNECTWASCKLTLAINRSIAIKICAKSVWIAFRVNKALKLGTASDTRPESIEINYHLLILRAK